MSHITVYNKITTKVTKVLWGDKDKDHTGGDPEKDYMVNADLSQVAGVNQDDWRVTGEVVGEIDNREVVSGVGDSIWLVENKTKRIDEIDTQTEILIGQGFDYEGSKYSLSPAAQRNQNWYYAAQAEIAFPIEFFKMDNSASIVFANSGLMRPFILAAKERIRSLVDGGTALKSAVVAATSKAELDAVIDNRT